MTTPQRVHITHEFKSDPQTVFDKLAEHENLGPVFGANITRVSDGATSRNGIGSVRRLKIGPLPAFEETTTSAEPNTLIEYKITKGSPLRGPLGPPGADTDRRRRHKAQLHDRFRLSDTRARRIGRQGARISDHKGSPEARRLTAYVHPYVAGRTRR